MKYMFFRDEEDFPYITEDDQNFKDSICECFEYYNAPCLGELFSKSIKNLTNRECIDLYNAITTEDEIAKVYEVGECIYDSEES